MIVQMEACLQQWQCVGAEISLDALHSSGNPICRLFNEELGAVAQAGFTSTHIHTIGSESLLVREGSLSGHTAERTTVYCRTNRRQDTVLVNVT